MNIESLTASQILAIKIPEKLFSSPAEAKSEYRKLAKKWHPDHGVDDHSVFQHIKSLWESAEKKIAADSWTIPGVHRIETKDGRKYDIRYRTHVPFELGDMFITDTVVVYLINNDFADLYENARRMIKFKYASDKMKKDFSRYVPEIMLEGATDTQQMVVYKKTPDLLLLRDVLNHFKGKMPSRHVAWILSTLYNLNCFLKYNGISHNAISPDTYFITPEHHSGAMLGGFWYSSRIGERMVAVPKRTIEHAPDLLKDKTSTPLLDSQLIKVTGLELLGDAYGTKLLAEIKDGKLPKPFMNFLRTPGANDAVEEYSTWRKKVLVESWGPPKFHEMKLTAGDLYE